MAERQVRPLPRSHIRATHEEIDVAAATQIVVFGEARIGHHPAVTRARGLDGGENIGRAAGAARSRSGDRRHARGTRSAWRTHSRSRDRCRGRSAPTASLNAIARRSPFLEKSMARWLAMPALPPLPTNMILLSPSWASCAARPTHSQPCSSGSACALRSVTSAPRSNRSSVAKYRSSFSRSSLLTLVEHVALPYFSRPVMPLISAALSIERRWPTISTLSAPTTLPMKPT